MPLLATASAASLTPCRALRGLRRGTLCLLAYHVQFLVQLLRLPLALPSHIRHPALCVLGNPLQAADAALDGTHTLRQLLHIAFVSHRRIRSAGAAVSLHATRRSMVLLTHQHACRSSHPLHHLRSRVFKHHAHCVIDALGR